MVLPSCECYELQSSPTGKYVSSGAVVMTDGALADSCGAGLELCSEEVIHAWPWKTWTQAHEKEVIGHRVNLYC